MTSTTTELDDLRKRVRKIETHFRVAIILAVFFGLGAGGGYYFVQNIRNNLLELKTEVESLEPKIDRSLAKIATETETALLRIKRTAPLELRHALINIPSNTVRSPKLPTDSFIVRNGRRKAVAIGRKKLQLQIRLSGNKPVLVGVHDMAVAGCGALELVRLSGGSKESVVSETTWLTENGVPASHWTIDQPGPGTHIYTVFLRCVQDPGDSSNRYISAWSKGGQLVACELK